MEQDVTEEYSNANLQVFDACTQNFWEGVEFYYNRHSYVEALRQFIEANTKLADATATPQELQRNIQYFMYKAWVMSSHDKTRELKLPISFLHLEGLIEQDVNPNRLRAVWMAKHFGRLGLRLFERFGDQETWH